MIQGHLANSHFRAREPGRISRLWGQVVPKKIIYDGPFSLLTLPAISLTCFPTSAATIRSILISISQYPSMNTETCEVPPPSYSPLPSPRTRCIYSASNVPGKAKSRRPASGIVTLLFNHVSRFRGDCCVREKLNPWVKIFFSAVGFTTGLNTIGAEAFPRGITTR
jgi:hypothetical protein